MSLIRSDFLPCLFVVKTTGLSKKEADNCGSAQCLARNERCTFLPFTLFSGENRERPSNCHSVLRATSAENVGLKAVLLVHS
jgi:hypothetical protein